MSSRKRTVIYVAPDGRGQAPFRYVRLLTLGRFEFALTWPYRRLVRTDSESEANTHGC